MSEYQDYCNANFGPEDISTMSKITASQRIIGAMERNKIQWGDVIQRVANDEELAASEAADLVSRLEGGGPCPVVVAAAIISIIADQRA